MMGASSSTFSSCDDVGAKLDVDVVADVSCERHTSSTSSCFDDEVFDFDVNRFLI